MYATGFPVTRDLCPLLLTALIALVSEVGCGIAGVLRYKKQSRIFMGLSHAQNSANSIHNLLW